MKKYNDLLIRQTDSLNGTDGSDNVQPATKVWIVAAGTRNLASLYDGEDINTANQITNPQTTDSYGRLSFYIEDGDYDFYINFNTDIEFKVKSSEPIYDVKGSTVGFNHSASSNRSAVGAHDEIYVRARTLSQAIAEDSPEGTRYTITDLDNARYDVVLADDAGSYYKTGLASGRKLKLIIDSSHVRLSWLGASGDVSQDATQLIIDAISLLRNNPVSIQQGIGAGSPIITAYSSGTIELGRGVYKISPDIIDITQDVGLRIVGQGYRGTQNFQYGSTTILVKGTSTGFGIRSFGNGGRSLQLENLDLCYDDSNFTGDLLDNFDSVGVKLDKVYLGCYGITSGTRLFTARSLFNTTYAEFVNFSNVVFNGAVNFVNFDHTRSVGGSPFGGSIFKFDHCTMYDCTGAMMKADGSRTVVGIHLDTVAFNPITSTLDACLDLNNVDSFNMESCDFNPSTTSTTNEFIRLTNVTGSITNNEFGSLSKAGTVIGDLHISGNKFGGTDGLTVRGGSISGGSNEFRTGTNGWLFLPNQPLAIDLGPDRFESGVTSSYYLPTDSVDVSGIIRYSEIRDSSSSKFEVNTARVRLEEQGKLVTVNSSLATPFTATGQLINVGGVNSSLSMTLPAPKYCTKYSYSKFLDAAYTLTIATPAGKNFMCGEPGARTQAVSTNPGSYIEFTALNADTYMVTGLHGDWVFS